MKVGLRAPGELTEKQADVEGGGSTVISAQVDRVRGYPEQADQLDSLKSASSSSERDLSPRYSVKYDGRRHLTSTLGLYMHTHIYVNPSAYTHIKNKLS